MNENISPQQVKAIKALLTNPTNKAEAEASGTPLRTLERWLTEPHFQTAIREAQNEVFQYVGSGLIGLQVKALEALNDILEHPAQPGASTKHKAAIEILRLGIEYQRIVVDETKIRNFEKKVYP